MLGEDGIPRDQKDWARAGPSQWLPDRSWSQERKGVQKRQPLPKTLPKEEPERKGSGFSLLSVSQKCLLLAATPQVPGVKASGKCGVL